VAVQNIQYYDFHPAICAFYHFLSARIESGLAETTPMFAFTPKLMRREHCVLTAAGVCLYCAKKSASTQYLTLLVGLSMRYMDSSLLMLPNCHPNNFYLWFKRAKKS
jgi:hypothetical protein